MSAEAELEELRAMLHYETAAHNEARAELEVALARIRILELQIAELTGTIDFLELRERSKQCSN